MTFSDITIVPVRRDRKTLYLKFSARMAAIYKEYGAVKITDFWQSETNTEDSDFHAEGAMADYEPGDLPDLKTLAGAEENEAVVVSITEWPSREFRDFAVKAIAVDPRIQATVDEDPVFDGARLVAGGFDLAFEL